MAYAQRMRAVKRLTDVELTRKRIAGEVRAELARAEIKPAHLPRLIGGSQSYWARRVTGEFALNVDDLSSLAELLGCEIAEFFPRERVVRREGIEPPTR